MILDRHYWWTNDQKSVVPDGHPDSAFLAFAKGHELADNLARKYGILKEEDDAADEAADAKDDADAKAKPAPANKARARTADKSGG